MRKIELVAAVAAAVVAISVPAKAQGRGRDNGGIPPGQRPPSGMCRIWIDGVPPGQQPAPTDCQTAERRRPANARVIYGDDTRRTTHPYGVYDSRGVRLPDQSGVYGRDGVYEQRDRVYRRDTDDDDRNRVYSRDNDDDDRSGKKLKASKNKSKHGKGKGKGHE